MNKAVISGDIIAYTSLNDNDKTLIESSIIQLFAELKSKFDIYGRLIKGDYIECYVPNPSHALRIALLIKSHIKSIFGDLKNPNNDNRISAIKIHGLRLAIGVGEINRFDPEKGIIDGDAIYFSGRIMNESRSTSNKERIVIKNTLFIKTKNEDITEEMEALLGLIDVLMSKATAKQCKVMFLKLMGKSEDEISSELAINQSTVNIHSTSLGWNAIEKAVQFFEKQIN